MSPSIKAVAGKTQIEVDRLDGGLNNSNSPNSLQLSESPDCLNVVFDVEGSVETRPGCSVYNTTPIGSYVVDGGATYNGSMLVWANGDMFRVSGTTAETISSGQGCYTAGQKVEAVVYQNMLMFSDGLAGPYRYHGASNTVYQLGIAAPGAVTGACNTVGATPRPLTGTHWYKATYVNTGVVEGDVGSSFAITLATSALVYLSSIPVGAASLGVAQRYLYRADDSIDGPYRYIGTLADNATTVYTDSVGPTTWAAGTLAPQDASKPTPWTTVKSHKNRLFFDDSSDRTILRYTDYLTPYISKAENFFKINQGDNSYINCVRVQQDLITAFKDSSYWLLQLTDPADDTTWVIEEGPGHVGIVGARAAVEINDGIIFLGKRNGFISGFHWLSGVNVLQSVAKTVKTNSISQRVDDTILGMGRTYWGNVAMGIWKDKVICSFTRSGSTNNAILWFDTARLSDTGYPGSWSLWEGRATQMTGFFEHLGKFYGTSVLGDGFIFEVCKDGQYNDADTPINSYWWSKPIGGEPQIESWIKDWRYVNVWFSTHGESDPYKMKVSYKIDGDITEGLSYVLDCFEGGTVWGAPMVWGTSDWGGGTLTDEVRSPIGPTRGRRLQVRFANQAAGSASAVTDTGFRVNNFKLLANLRRQS